MPYFTYLGENIINTHTTENRHDALKRKTALSFVTELRSWNVSLLDNSFLR
jgi:hypothetical protein